MPSLSARSVVASTLLGTLPPRLPGRLLVAFAEEFGINPGTTRVALSRMVDRGELTRDDDSVYHLAGDLLDRQGRQEAGLAAVTRAWDGDWEIHVVRTGGRDAGDRAALRRAAVHLGLAEHRDGVWMRPANLDPQRLPSARMVVAEQADRFVGRPDGSPAELAAALFDLDAWSAATRRLVASMEATSALLEADGDVSLADGFELAASSLRHLVADPLLPPSLTPSGWPASDLRAAYDRYNRAYRARLSAFFRARSRVAG
ncbi:MAG: PaaX family transcriptional regulator C-terminal domain-containing protein [Acidimicrobiales bacterium]|nr:PaaX family transcriptional regulator C-terminal domain-containing protein [Acidimicrobiales bacterium]